MDRYDVLAAIGLICAAVGVGLIYAPLGLIVIGVGLIGGALLGARGSVTVQMDARHAQDQGRHSGMTKET